MFVFIAFVYDSKVADYSYDFKKDQLIVLKPNKEHKKIFLLIRLFGKSRIFLSEF